MTAACQQCGGRWFVAAALAVLHQGGDVTVDCGTCGAPSRVPIAHLMQVLGQASGVDPNTHARWRFVKERRRSQRVAALGRALVAMPLHEPMVESLRGVRS